MLNVNLEFEGLSEDKELQSTLMGAFYSIAIRLLNAQPSSSAETIAQTSYTPSSIQTTDKGISFETNLDLLNVIQGLGEERCGHFINTVFGEKASISASVSAVSEPHYDASQNDSATITVQCDGFGLNTGVR